MSFSTIVFREADRHILRYNGKKYPGSVLVINDGASAEGKEAIVHWKDNPTRIEDVYSYSTIDAPHWNTLIHPDFFYL